MRTNQHFTLKTNPLKIVDLQDFIKCYNPENLESALEQFKSIYEELGKEQTIESEIPRGN